MTYPVIHDGRMFTETGEVTPPHDITTREVRITLNCGHKITTVAGIAGFAFIMGSYTVCYPCMTEWERSFFTESDVFTGYLSAGQDSFTTWTGGELARITHVSTSGPIWTPTGGRYRRVSVRATAPDGSRWHGQGTDQHCLITLRRCKGGA